jgi:hypothetical protein
LLLAGSLAISVALSALFEPSLSWRMAGTDVILKAAALLGCGALMALSWCLAGARPPLRTFLVSYAHWFAAGLLIVSLLATLDRGALRMIRPGWFAQIARVTSAGQDTRRLTALVGSENAYALKVLLESDAGLSAIWHAPAFPWIACLAAVRGAFSFAWLLVFWNRWRRWLALGWARAAVSLAIFIFLMLIAALAAVVIHMEPLMVDPGRWMSL